MNQNFTTNLVTDHWDKMAVAFADDNLAVLSATMVLLQCRCPTDLFLVSEEALRAARFLEADAEVELGAGLTL
jgi:hypothetical protein